MAWRIDRHVVKGEIHNLIKGKVAGKIWLKGLNQPLELNLQGNAYRDMAGATLRFVNPAPEEGEYTGLDVFQDGKVGDMTASKRVKAPANPEDLDDEDVERIGRIAYTWSNCLYLEWFSRANGRVLIETTDFKWRLSLPSWQLHPGEEDAQRRRNQREMIAFMDQLSKAIDREIDALPEEGEMNEFQWESYLQKSDARSEMLLELFEKYEDHPQCEELIAEAMGWELAEEDDSEEAFDDEEAFDREWAEGEEAARTETEEDVESYEPRHPIVASMMEATANLFYETDSRGLLNDEPSNPWNQLIWHSQMTVSKLIASLEDVAEGVDLEPGFLVATLKRALHLLHLTIATLEAAASAPPKRYPWAKEARRELFDIRESIIDLMQAFREKGP